MREVHASQFQLTLDCALENGFTRRELDAQAGLTRSTAELYARDYVSWGDFARLLNTIDRLRPQTRWPDLIAAKFLDLPLNRRLQALFRHAGDPLLIYQGMNRFFGPYQYPCITSTLKVLDGRHVEFSHRIEPVEFVFSELFLSGSLRCLELAPRVFMGLPEARGDYTTDGGPYPRFSLVVPRSRSFYARLKGAAQTFRGSSETLDVLELQAVEVRQRLKALDMEAHAKQADIDARSLELERLNAELREARQENDAKTHYLASLSHELRTPLNAIIGGTEMVIEEMTDDGVIDYAEDLDRINQAGRHLLGLIEHVLDLSKIEAGRMALDLEPIELTHFIEALMAPMELLARKQRVELTHENTCSHDTIHGDALRLRQILTNLLGNALKFAPGERVCLRVRDVEGASDRIAIEVEDHGIGIEADSLETLFAPFAQADASIHKRFGGTGLGLTIAREFALLMGGELRVESVVGEGTCFTLEIPVKVTSGEQ